MYWLSCEALRREAEHRTASSPASSPASAGNCKGFASVCSRQIKLPSMCPASSALLLRPWLRHWLKSYLFFTFAIVPLTATATATAAPAMSIKCDLA